MGVEEGKIAPALNNSTCGFVQIRRVL